MVVAAAYHGRRSPHGERGLKYAQIVFAYRRYASLPARGAWIEIVVIIAAAAANSVAPRTGSVD